MLLFGLRWTTANVRRTMCGSASGAVGRGFKSLRARQILLGFCAGTLGKSSLL